MDTTIMEQIKVEVVSNEMVKPSLPSSSHPKTFTLCSLDQVFPPIHIPVIVFYTSRAPTATPQVSLSQTLDHIKASLSLTLDHFYPIAGQLLDESTVSCNNQGIPFIQTKVDCNLSDVIASSHKLKLLTKFLPPHEMQTLRPRPISESSPLVIQVNVFLCGGVVIGCYVLHKLFDAVSLGTFFKYWSSLASDRVDSLIQPDFEATTNAFPPISEGLQQVFSSNMHKHMDKLPSNDVTSVVDKSFIFTSVALNNLKVKAASKQVPAPTRFEALAGFLWNHLLLATTTATTRGLEDNTVFLIAVNMRPRMRPPLPNQSMGNVVTSAMAQANNSSSKLQQLVQEIHSALYHVNHKIQTIYQGDNIEEAICRERETGLQGMINNDKGLRYNLSSWCNNGLSEADFGFGKPTSILPIDGRPLPMLENFIFFTDYRNPITGDLGIEVWLVLGEKQMHILETNPHFLSFASPN